MNSLLSAGVAFVLSALCGAILIPQLRRLNFGSVILEVGPRWHANKAGTPIMGGLIFAFGTLVSSILILLLTRTEIRQGIWILGFGLSIGAVGFLDDWIGIKKKRNMGLHGKQKLLFQLILTTGFLLGLYFTHSIDTTVKIPFFHIQWEMPVVLFFIGGLLVISGFINAVNLTDGVDGLCTGVTIPVLVFLCLRSYQNDLPDVALVAAALAGALLGFLLFNYHPARVFMGDTGSLFLGGMLSAIALMSKDPLSLLVVGLMYLFELFSVIIQVTYFKATHGKRFFKMSPLHHHLELSHWSEYKIFYTFTLVTAALCALTFFFG
jgi:phospho-N-acetylmuramoyl-pentapeptide-transferase